MGYAKWALPFALFSGDIAVRLAKRLHQKDMRSARTLGKGLWRCMQVTMRWEKR